MFVTSKIPKSLSAEAYRSLRTSIKYAAVDKPLKRIVVTSSLPGEGKSTVSGNLAFTLSDTGSRVLIMDCDFRNPSLHQKFGVSNEKGLTDYLVDKADFKKLIKPITKSLYFMPCGTIPPNPSEILGSESMEILLKELEINFDYIILDTPPVIPVTDALILAGKADGTILVVRSNKVKEKIIKQSYGNLKSVNANVIGTVLNASSTRNNKYYGYYGEKEKKSLFDFMKRNK